MTHDKRLFLTVLIALFLLPFGAFAQGWQVIETGGFAPFLDIQASSPFEAYAVGGMGTIMRTSNGNTWEDYSQELMGNFRAIDFADDQVGTAVGNPNAIWTTSNGGDTWTAQTNGPDNLMFTWYDVMMMDADNAIAVGQDMTSSRAIVAHTTDGWATWDTLTFAHEYDGTVFPATLRRIEVKNASTLVGIVDYGMENNPSGAVVESSDNGTTWTVVNTLEFSPSDIAWIDEMTGYVVGTEGGGTKTMDGGENWLPLMFPSMVNLNCVTAATPALVFVGGVSGTLFKSTMGGMGEWIDQTSPSMTGNIFDIEMASNDIGWAASDMGRILFTTDGGGEGGGGGNNPPGDFFYEYPIGEEIMIGNVDFLWTQSVDPDTDLVSYNFSIYSPIVFDSTVTDTTIQVDFTQLFESLSEPTQIMWRVQATDGDLTTTPTGFPPDFMLLPDTTSNRPPQGFDLIYPARDDTLRDMTAIDFQWEEAIDPEGAPVHYTLTLDVNMGRDVAMHTTVDLDSTHCVYDFADFFEENGMGLYRVLWNVEATDSSFVTPMVEPGHFSVAYIPSSVEDDPAVHPANFQFTGAWPNPFNPSTTLAFTLPEKALVRMQIFDVLGRRVRTLVDGTLHAGEHQVVWNGRDERGTMLASGLYLVRCEATGADAGRQVAWQRVTLLK